MPRVLDVVGDVDDDKVAGKTDPDLAVNVGWRLPVARARYGCYTIVA